MTVSSVPMLEPTRMSSNMREKLLQAMTRVLDSGRYILGPEVSAFEEECAAYVGAPYVIGVSSGTDALLASLMALELGPGDEVICPTYTFFSTAGAVSRVGAKPVFVDIGLQDFNCDPQRVADAITPRTRAVIPVHLFGQCADMTTLLELLRDRSIAVIEDAAQALGAMHANTLAGNFGTCGCFSFFPSKNLGAVGDAGLIVTHDSSLATKLRHARAHGSNPKYHHYFVGGNFRIDALQAALLRVKLETTDAIWQGRQANAERYTRLFRESGITCIANEGQQTDQVDMMYPVSREGRHIFNQYVIRVPHRRDALREHLAERKVATEIYYPVPLHLQECYRSLGGQPGHHPMAERAASETLALPIFAELRPEEIETVASHIVDFFT